MTLLIDVAIRCSLVLVAGLAAAWLLRGRSAALRHCVLAAAVFSAVAVLPLALVVPPVDLPRGCAAAVGDDVRPGEVSDSASATARDPPASAHGARPPRQFAATGRASPPVRARCSWRVWAAGVLAAAGVLVLAGRGPPRLDRVSRRAPAATASGRRAARQIAGGLRTQARGPGAADRRARPRGDVGAVPAVRAAAESRARLERGSRPRGAVPRAGARPAARLAGADERRSPAHRVLVQPDCLDDLRPAAS